MLNKKFYSQCFVPQITNSSWESEIKGQGSKVIIRKIPTINISDYQVNGVLSYQSIADDKLELLIDKAKSYSFKLDDIDEVQADINLMKMLTGDASYQMKIAIETAFLSTVYSDAATNVASTAIDKTNILDWIIDQEVILEENNAPMENRWMILPPKAAGMLQKSDVKNANEMGDSKSIARGGMTNGLLGKVGSFDIYVSNQLTKTGVAGPAQVTHAMSGQKSAITFASQYVKTESVRLQDSFGDAIRGLNVYGYKTVNPEVLVHAPITFA